MKATLHNWGNNETYKRNVDSERNSYTLIQGQVAGSNAGQYIKAYKKRTGNVKSRAEQASNVSN